MARLGEKYAKIIEGTTRTVHKYELGDVCAGAQGLDRRGVQARARRVKDGHTLARVSAPAMHIVLGAKLTFSTRKPVV